jgi:fructose-1,6-bisphosphatase II
MSGNSSQSEPMATASREAPDRNLAVDPIDGTTLAIDDLVRGDNCFFAATGITDGELLHGVHYDRRGATTQSLAMRSKSGPCA